MFCPLCGYMMEVFDKVCPRCQGKGMPKPAPPAQAAPAQPTPQLPLTVPSSTPTPGQPSTSITTHVNHFLQAFHPNTQAIAGVEEFTPHQDVWSKDRKSGLAVDEGRGLICLIWAAKSSQWQRCILMPKDIVEVQIVEDEHIVVSENSSSRTKAGGAGLVAPVLGVGIGMMKGGARTQGKQKAEQFEEVTRIDLKIQTNDLRRPFHVVNFMQHWKTNRRGFVYPKAREQADYWHALLVALMRRSESRAES